MKKTSTVIFLFIAISFLKPNFLRAQVSVQDSLALVDLYNNTDGPNWTNQTGWLTAAPVSKWSGVAVLHNRVTHLLLYNHNLNGKIPSSIGKLTKLRYLEFPYNSLHGNIPTQIGNLKNLEYLDLQHNKLTGTIPAALGNLSKLRFLILDSNRTLSGNIPSVLGNLLNLYHLSLAHNQLSGNIPVELSHLTILTVLNLSDNKLSGSIPPSFGNLTSLVYLFLQDNQLSGSIPSELGNLGKLRSLYLSFNKLNGNIPNTLGSIKSLQSLYLDHNNLSGRIPSELGKIGESLLVTLKLSHNQLSDTIPFSLTRLNNLSELYLDHNKFTFAGMGNIVSYFDSSLRYSPQANIPLHNNNNILSVSVGSILAHNTYKWFKDGVKVAVINGDSTYQPAVSGSYYVKVINSVAKQLILYSDTINYTAGDNSIALKLNNNSSISIYPNPAKSFTTLSFNADGKYAITIADVSGKILQTKTGVAIKGKNIIQLDVSKYASGIYLITIGDEKNRKQTIRLNKE